MLEITQYAADVAGALASGTAASVVIGGLAYACIRLLNRFADPSAATRYTIWTATLAAVVAVHVFTMTRALAPPAAEPIAVRGGATPQAASSVSPWAAKTAPTESWSAESNAPLTTEAHGVQAPAMRDDQTQADANASVTAASARPVAVLSVNLTDTPALTTLILASLWLLVSAFGLLRLMLGYLKLGRIRSTGRVILPSLVIRPGFDHGLSREFSIVESDRIESPVAGGLFHPAILIPVGLRQELNTEEVEPIVLHEAAHLVRRDDYTLLLQRLAEAVLFFNPLVWWLARQMNDERELACDAWVISRTRNPEGYVQSVKRLIELRLGSAPLTVVPGLATKPAKLVDRMRVILQKGVGLKTGSSFEQVALVVALIALAVAVTVVTRPLVTIGLDAGESLPQPVTFTALGAPPTPATVAVRPEEPLPREVREPSDVVESEPQFTDDPDLSPEAWAKLFHVATGISSDGDRARVLRRAAGRIPDHGPTYVAWINAAETIRSSSELGAVLSEILRRENRSALPYEALIGASAAIKSSGERARFLRQVIRQAPEQAAINNALVRAVESVTSRSERERLQREIVSRRGDG